MKFDHWVDRRDSDSSRWGGKHGQVVLTTGDSDFQLPPPISAAVRRRLDGVLGYDNIPSQLSNAICTRLARQYEWQIDPAWLVFLPGIVQGLNICCHALLDAGEAVITETPVYYPFLEAPVNAGRALVSLPARLEDGRWGFDIDGYAQLAAVPANRLLLLCNPQNPLGRMLTIKELQAIADISAAEDVLICSDEIHAEVRFDSNRHYPLAAVCPEIADRVITMLSPSKAFAMSGLGGAFAVISDDKIRGNFVDWSSGLIPNLNSLTLAAMDAAYRDCDPWLAEAMDYLADNRAYLEGQIAALPGITCTRPEGTYFLWLDVTATGLDDAYDALLQAGLELSPGDLFGGPGFLRLNFASPREVLVDAVQIMREVFSSR